MQTEMNTPEKTEGFNQMAEGLNRAITEFSEESPDFLQTITSALKPIGEYALSTYTSASNLVRRYPVQTAIGVVAAGFLVARLVNRGESTPARSSDGRQY